MDRLKLAQLGERLKTGGAQMGRMVSGKMKEILQSPTPESKMVDEATLETLEEPNWGMNLRICAMINSEEFNGTEIVKTIKKKISGKSVASQRLSLDLLEACTMNCEKVFSEVASEKVLEDMVRMIDNPQTDHGNRKKALQLIRAWGESEDVAYLPVFHQTYMSLKARASLPLAHEGNSSPSQYSLESYIHQDSLSPPERYPIPDTGLHDTYDAAFSFNHQSLSVEEKKEHLVVTRNSIELLSSILNTEAETKSLKEDLTLNLLEKCKHSQPIIKGIVEGTTDDEGMLFEALYLNDELQRVISKFEELEAAQEFGGQQSEDADSKKNEVEAAHNPGGGLPESSNNSKSQELEAAKHGEELPKKPDTPEVNLTAGADSHSETKIVDSLGGKDAESSCKRNAE
ncbi:TOM1-like protein 2 [Quillaja saponaria]|uniref:TOM1-like protein 2 n=1 Tax=Quillaja saponaria TaxID=32244 RepID=A0AAD7Q978_QUISA|nr:TOM1-like protein 2 [Quillaja saponaria]